MPLAAVRSKAVAMFLLIRCLLLPISPIVGYCNGSMFRCAFLYVHSRFAIKSMGKRELVPLLCLPGVS